MTDSEILMTEVEVVNIIVTSSDSFTPLHPNISMHILHTVLYTFPKMLTRRICITNQEHYCVIQG